jgi:hypothetical protein
MSILRSSRSLEWAGSPPPRARAIGYALLVRVYQGLGGTIGLAGTFDDPDGFRRASLTAAAFLALVGIGALAFVLPWGGYCAGW